MTNQNEVKSTALRYVNMYFENITFKITVRIFKMQSIYV